MFLNYNFKIIREEEFKIDFKNRGFQYNDGLFDTLIFKGGKILFLYDHLDRLNKALIALDLLPIPQFNNHELFKDCLLDLINRNNLNSECVRIKINIWRKSGGLFTPESEEAEILITLQTQILSISPIQKAEFYYTLKNRFTPFSFFKGPYSLHYIKGSVFKKKRGLDELILFNEDDNISECLVSNIFWIKNLQIFTPSIESGCIAGIMRLNILKLCNNESILINEGLFNKTDLLNADFIFTSNVTGLRPILKLGEKTFPHTHPIFDKINIYLSNT